MSSVSDSAILRFWYDFDTGDFRHAARVKPAIGKAGMRPGNVVEEFQTGCFAVSLTRSLRDGEVAFFCHDYEVVIHDDGEAISRLTRSP